VDRSGGPRCARVRDGTAVVRHSTTDIREQAAASQCRSRPSAPRLGHSPSSARTIAPRRTHSAPTPTGPLKATGLAQSWEQGRGAFDPSQRNLRVRGAERLVELKLSSSLPVSSSAGGYGDGPATAPRSIPAPAVATLLSPAHECKTETHPLGRTLKQRSPRANPQDTPPPTFSDPHALQPTHRPDRVRLPDLRPRPPSSPYPAPASKALNPLCRLTSAAPRRAAATHLLASLAPGSSAGRGAHAI